MSSESNDEFDGTAVGLRQLIEAIELERDSGNEQVSFTCTRNDAMYAIANALVPRNEQYFLMKSEYVPYMFDLVVILNRV